MGRAVGNRGRGGMEGRRIHARAIDPRREPAKPDAQAMDSLAVIRQIIQGRPCNGGQRGFRNGRWGRWRRCALYRTRSEEHTSELQSLMRISYAVFCLKKKKQKT